MALKKKLTKEEFEKIGDHFKSEYEEKEGGYHLKLEDDIDTGALLRAKEHEKDNRKAAEAKAKELEKQLAELKASIDTTNQEGMKKAGQIDLLEKSYQEKLSKTEKEAAEKISKWQNTIKKNLLESTANSIAKEISTSPEIISRFITDRLSVDFDSEVPTIKVLDASGNLSASTLEDLKKEFSANKTFAPIIISSKASGGSATDQNKNDFSAGSSANPPKPLSNMSPAELAKHIAHKVK